jgi:hypothetical protein
VLELEIQFKQIAELVALAIEAGAVLIVTFGALQALTGLAGAVFTRPADEMRGREMGRTSPSSPSSPPSAPCSTISSPRTSPPSMLPANLAEIRLRPPFLPDQAPISP